MSRVGDLPPARQGVKRFAILVVGPNVFDVIEPLLPAIQDGLDFARLRPDWYVSHYVTRDTLHVTTAPLDNVLSSGFGKHLVTLTDALQAMKG